NPKQQTSRPTKATNNNNNQDVLLVLQLSNNITKLQRTYFSGEADGDTEDDTHVCRVLRAYYIEKGQHFPSWLPPDPKAPPPVQQQQQQQQQQGQQQRYNGYG
ncbi:hypothetical protein KEM56_006336, partial [Ascosphaera pollenicola]